MADSTDPKNTVTLVVPKFRKYAVKSFYHTSYFYIGEAKHCFYLTVYPHGFSDREKDYVSLWVQKFSENEMLIDFTCCVLNDQDVKIHEKTIKQNLALESVLGWSTFCRRHIILDKRNNVLKDGNLTLKVTLTVLEDSVIPNAETEYHDPFFKKSLLELSSNLHSLYSEKTFSDVTIRVDGEKLSAHKCVLSARSPVLKDLLSGSSNELEVTDISANTYKEILHFLYTGKIDTVTRETAFDLYCAASKYGLLYLRKICSEMLENNLESDNVIKNLLLADQHTDRELLDSCLCFMDKHLREIKGTKEWISLMKSRPDLANRAIFFQADA